MYKKSYPYNITLPHCRQINMFTANNIHYFNHFFDEINEFGDYNDPWEKEVYDQAVKESLISDYEAVKQEYGLNDEQLKESNKSIIL